MCTRTHTSVVYVHICDPQNYHVNLMQEIAKWHLKLCKYKSHSQQKKGNHKPLKVQAVPW